MSETDYTAGSAHPETVADIISRAKQWHDLNVPLFVDLGNGVEIKLAFRYCSTDGLHLVPAREDPPIKANPCSSCGASAAYCEQHIKTHRRGCCARCYTTDTHDMTTEDWRRFREAQEASGA